MKKTLITGIAALSMILVPTLAEAHGGHYDGHYGGHGGPGRVIVVKPGYHHYGPPPARHYYHHGNALAGIATFAVFAGITYAIVNNAYYRQQGDRYVYVDTPPAGSYRVVNQPGTTTTVTTTTTTSVARGEGLSPGTVVDEIVGPTKKVAYEGRLYYIADGIWYLPVDGGSQFVVVQPRY
ncbi:hypothetical protein [Gallaecimonas pentaromativorans]|uniref:hypothetical protein n=1 Tax=Gallaecimonas pentaromativorans TaxID=584787 RepID=UPI003A94181C